MNATLTFLPLEYTKHHFGQPVEAQSNIVQYIGNVVDDIDVETEWTIESSYRDTINDPDTFCVWVRHTVKYNWQEVYTVTSWYQSPLFARFVDAEAYCQFAYSRWQATGFVSSSGIELRDDLDEKRNPIF